MPKVRKPCGAMEEFDRARLQHSIMSSGASPETAREIADKLQPFDGVDVDDIRKTVARELKTTDARLEQSYLRSENLISRSSSALAPGVAEISDDVMRRLMASPGERAVLRAGSSVTDVKVQPRNVVPPTEIRVSKRDIERLDARDGARVTVSFHQ